MDATPAEGGALRRLGARLAHSGDNGPERPVDLSGASGAVGVETAVARVTVTTPGARMNRVTGAAPQRAEFAAAEEEQARVP